MDRIDALLQKATPNLGRREYLRNVFHEWERVENQIRGEIATTRVPLVRVPKNGI